MKKRKKKRSALLAPIVKPQVFLPVPFGASSDSLSPLPRGQYWLRQTGDDTQNSGLGPTDLEEELDMGGFKFEDSTAGRWALVAVEPELTSCAALLRKFRAEAGWWRKPMVWARNPEGRDGVPMFGNQDIIVVLYGKHFYIAIERNDMFGPHACRLYYRSYQFVKEIAWIAITQIEGMWHSDERLLKALNHEIRNRKFWQSKATAATIVLV